MEFFEISWGWWKTTLKMKGWIFSVCVWGGGGGVGDVKQMLITKYHF